MPNKIFRLSLVLFGLVILVSGCSMPWKKPAVPADQGQIEEPATSTEQVEEPVATNDLKKFSSYQELKAFLEENAASGGVTYGFSSIMRNAVGLAAAPTALSADSSESAQAADSSVPNNSLDYSSTNNQVAGVDEPDIIKTDGNYVYALVRNELSIIKANPASEAAVVSKITFKSRPQDIFISGTSLAVFGSDNQIYAQPVYQTFRRQNLYTFFKVFDLSDPANPKLVRDLDFEGSYVGARLIGDYVYFLSSSYAYYVDKEPLAPRLISGGEVLSSDCSAASASCFAPDVYYFDIPYESYNYTTISAINLKNSGEPVSGQVYLLDSSQNIYVSSNNIYITYTKRLNEYDLEQTIKKELIQAKLSAEDQAKITEIEAVPSYILNASEKKAKVALIVDRYLSSLTADEQTTAQTEIDQALKQKLIDLAKEMEKTVIHKIAISGDKIEYQAKGEVSGQVLNQFSMDEWGNYFRIATTRNQLWSRLTEINQDSYSNLYVLDADLKTVGSLENLATTERIYAARFLGDRAYLVTFRQTDPLYVIGLSDPAKPAVLGAIKVPGFSNYLQPVDDSGAKMIGLGRETETDENGNVKVKGLKLSLFDFSDLAHPKEADSYRIGDERSSSVALDDHRAFLYSAAKNLLVMPAAFRDESGKLSFAGALVFNINGDQLNLQGRIDHSAGGHFTQSDYWGGVSYYDNTVKRSLYISDNLFTFSNKFLKINNLADLAPLKEVTLTTNDDFVITTATSSPDGTEPAAPTEDGGVAAEANPNEGADATGTSTNP